MKIISTISDTLGYTLDTYSIFDPTESIADEDWAENTDFDHAAYVKDLAAHQVDVLNGYTDEIVKGFTLEGAYSPREYNFKTDNSELQIELDDVKLSAYIRKNRPEFEQYLKDNFTSYDGFMSYVPNNWSDFNRELCGYGADWHDRLPDNIAHDRNWAIMLGWYMRRELLSADSYLEDMYEGLSEIAYNNATNLAEEGA